MNADTFATIALWLGYGLVLALWALGLRLSISRIRSTATDIEIREALIEWKANHPEKWARTQERTQERIEKEA